MRKRDDPRNSKNLLLNTVMAVGPQVSHSVITDFADTEAPGLLMGPLCSQVPLAGALGVRAVGPPNH